MSPLLPAQDRFSLKELAKAIDKDISTIFRWSGRGVRGNVLRSYLIGGQRYVDRRDFLAFLRAINAARADPGSIPDPGHDEAMRRVDQELDRAKI